MEKHYVEIKMSKSSMVGNKTTVYVPKTGTPATLGKSVISKTVSLRTRNVDQRPASLRASAINSAALSVMSILPKNLVPVNIRDKVNQIRQDRARRRDTCIICSSLIISLVLVILIAVASSMLQSRMLINAARTRHPERPFKMHDPIEDAYWIINRYSKLLKKLDETCKQVHGPCAYFRRAYVQNCAVEQCDSLEFHVKVVLLSILTDAGLKKFDHILDISAPLNDSYKVTVDDGTPCHLSGGGVYDVQSSRISDDLDPNSKSIGICVKGACQPTHDSEFLLHRKSVKKFAINGIFGVITSESDKYLKCHTTSQGNLSTSKTYGYMNDCPGYELNCQQFPRVFPLACTNPFPRFGGRSCNDYTLPGSALSSAQYPFWVQSTTYLKGFWDGYVKKSANMKCVPNEDCPLGAYMSPCCYTTLTDKRHFGLQQPQANYTGYCFSVLCLPPNKLYHRPTDNTWKERIHS